jgi:hypothetical protein
MRDKTKSESTHEKTIADLYAPKIGHKTNVVGLGLPDRNNLTGRDYRGTMKKPLGLNEDAGRDDE